STSSTKSANASILPNGTTRNQKLQERTSCWSSRRQRKRRLTGYPETAKLVYGVVFALRYMASKLSNQGFSTYKTGTYKLHYFESPAGAGPKLVLITDPNAPNMAGTLQSICASMYVEHVAKNTCVIFHTL
ncbi:hypothetical protein BJ741DRAFT_616679, partial [Chytriomyces cf. hyalinus JEL632]